MADLAPLCVKIKNLGVINQEIKLSALQGRCFLLEVFKNRLKCLKILKKALQVVSNKEKPF